MKRSRPLSFRAQQAVEKIKADLAYRTPSGHPQNHVVLRRDSAAALLSTVRRLCPDACARKHVVQFLID